MPPWRQTTNKLKSLWCLFSTLLISQHLLAHSPTWTKRHTLHVKWFLTGSFLPTTENHMVLPPLRSRDWTEESNNSGPGKLIQLFQSRQVYWGATPGLHFKHHMQISEASVGNTTSRLLCKRNSHNSLTVRWSFNAAPSCVPTSFTPGQNRLSSLDPPLCHRACLTPLIHSSFPSPPIFHSFPPFFSSSLPLPNFMLPQRH